MKIVFDLLAKLKDDDPVGGFWSIGSYRDGILWGDESSLAIGAALEINHQIV